MKFRKRIVLFCILGIFLLSGCNGNTDTSSVQATERSVEQQTQAQEEIFAMDTYMTVTAFGENAQSAADAAIEEIQRLDELLSTGNEKSEVWQMNENGGGTLSEDTEYLLKRATELCKETDGAFDITVYPIMEAWGFTTENFQVPSEDTLQKLLAITDGTQVSFDESTKEMSFGMDGMKMDFGGIAKGYTSSRIIEIWKEQGITSGLVNLGGNVQALGCKTDGSNWKIGIQNPEGEGSYIGVLETKDKAVVTSGGYERYFEQDGNLYHHIIDPTTGYPAENGLESVTIVSTDGTLADGLSTALFVMGKDKAVEYWKLHSDMFDVILLTEDKKIFVTEGIKGDFTSDMPVEVVNK